MSTHGSEFSSTRSPRPNSRACGRLGGDEFVVLLDATSRRETIEPIMAKIFSGIGQPIPIGEGRSAAIGASVGAAVFDGETREELIRRADAAMFRAKEKGRNTWCFYPDAASL